MARGAERVRRFLEERGIEAEEGVVLDKSTRTSGQRREPPSVFRIKVETMKPILGTDLVDVSK